MIPRQRFVFGLVSGALIAPLAAKAQPAGKVPRIGFLVMGRNPGVESAFPRGLDELGQSPTFSIARTERRVADLAIANQLPAIGMFRTWVEVGGLMSYGVNVYGLLGHGVGLLDKILKGAWPSSSWPSI